MFAVERGSVDMCSALLIPSAPSSPSLFPLGKDGLLRNRGWLQETCPTQEAERVWLGFFHKWETEEIFRKSIGGLEVRQRKGLLPAKDRVGNTEQMRSNSHE